MMNIELDQLVVAAWQARRLAGERLRYDRPTEQMFFHYPDGRIVYAPVFLRGARQCSDGSSYDEYAPRSAPVSGFNSVIHTHQDRASVGSRHAPWPGPRDGVAPRRNNIANYGLSSIGAWVVRPGLTLSVELLAGQWGARFNPQAFADAINRGGGDITVATGVVCQ